MRRIFSLIVLGLTATLSIAQQTPQPIRFEHLTVADGLPENSVNCILQDHLGFIWLGTRNGLVRYDGNKMASFQYSLSNYSFRGKQVDGLLEDQQGDIWIRSESIVRFERSTQRFIEYIDKNNAQTRDNDEINFIHLDKQGMLWTTSFINGQDILTRFDPKTNAWVYFNNDPINFHSLAGNRQLYSEAEFAEDEDGKIWITTIGLNKESILKVLDPRTDKFIQYRPKLTAAEAEDFMKPFMVSSGRHGLLYLSSFEKGFFILNPKNGEVKQYKHNAKDPGSLLSDSTHIAYEDKMGFVWIPTSKGLDRYDLHTNIFTHYISMASEFRTPGARWVYDPYETPEGDLWFKNPGLQGISFYRRKTNSFTRYNRDDNKEATLWGLNYKVFIDRTGMVWIGSWAGGLNKESRISQFLLIKKRPGNDSTLEDDDVSSIYEAPSEPGIIWFGTAKGLDRYDKKTGRYTHYNHDDQKPNSISNGGVSSITEDKKGRFWIGTTGGLDLMNRKDGSYIHFRHDTSNTNSLCNNVAESLTAASDGTLWIATIDGLDHFDYDARKFIHFKKGDTSYPPELFELISHFTIPERRIAAIVHPGNKVNTTVSFNLVKAADLLVTGMGQLTSANNADHGWVEDTKGKIIWDMDFANTMNDGNGRLRASIIHLDAGTYLLRYKSDGNYSYGHWDKEAPLHPDLWGIQITKISAGEAEDFSKKASTSYFTGLGANHIHCITEDLNKNIWIGSHRAGVIKFNPATREFVSYRDKFKGPFDILGGILEDRKTGNFWVGDYIFGLLLMNPKGEIVKTYNAFNGLSCNSVLGICMDSTGILWISTTNGLCRFDPATEKFLLFNKKNGLQGLIFNRLAFCETADGEMYFGGKNGANAFYPSQIILDSVASLVVLTDLDINGKQATIGKNAQMPVHISVAKDIELPYDLNELTFHFTSLLYNRGNESQFTCKLSPNDKDWVQLGTMRQAHYTNLSPGKYTFTVKAANADGVWNENGISITIHILPPWWITWWAYVLYIFILIGSIYGIIAYRSVALRRENKILEGKVELRTNQLQTSLENLKATQSLLIQSEKMASLGELTAGIAHEIQNPLNFVNNFSEVNKELIDEASLANEAGHPYEVKELLSTLKDNEEKINHHGKRADAIVKGMMQHSRRSSGLKEPTDINALADEYLRLSYHGLRAKDNSFYASMKADFDKSIANINIISQDIGRVLLNLYNNAFYAVYEKKKSAADGYEPTVSINTKKADNKIVITIKDNGNGIPQKSVDKIFQPFFTTKPTGQGTGLGLSLSYEIIKAHGGEIKVETKEGEYTEFVIQLPILT
jgi:signal transduction histidine kinase/ligand-binding sensor domain-containing protein